MRMWMIPPVLMCKQHISGEHGELHKHLHNFEKKQRMAGRFEPIVQIVPHRMKQRHDELAKYLNHKSPFEMPDISYLPPEHRYAEADTAYNIEDLASRCPDCRAKMQAFVDAAAEELNNPTKGDER